MDLYLEEVMIKKFKYMSSLGMYKGTDSLAELWPEELQRGKLFPVTLTLVYNF